MLICILKKNEMENNDSTQNVIDIVNNIDDDGDNPINTIFNNDIKDKFNDKFNSKFDTTLNNNCVSSSNVNDKYIQHKHKHKPVFTFDSLHTCSNSDYDSIKDVIDTCLLVIARVGKMCNGLLVGGVVRDYFIMDEIAKDVDLRFSSFQDIDKFMYILKQLHNVEILEQSENKSRTLFVKKCEVIFVLSNAICMFDVDITTKMDTTSISYDFICNGITYDGTNFGFIENNDQSLLELAITHISQKIMVPNPRLLVSSRQNMRRKQCYLYRISKFQERGWTIVDCDKIIESLG